MSSPPSSLHSSPPNDDEQPPSPPSEIPAPPDPEPLLHLVPRTWDEFLRLEPPASGLYEYVDGYVIWRPIMADSDHVTMSLAHSTVLSCSQDVIIVPTPSVELVNDRDHGQYTIDHEDPSRMQTRQSAARDRARGSSSRDPHSASSNRASSSRDPATIQSDMRHPDFAIVKPKTNSADSSGTSRDPLAKKRIYFAHPLPVSLLALVEITSHSTRNTDLNAKWTSYARSKVPMYIIIDRGTGRAGTKRIIVGTLEPLGSGTLQSMSADRHVPPPATSLRITRRNRPTYPPRYYFRKVYTGNDIVDCPYYRQLALEASKLLDIGFMNTLSTQMGNEQRGRRRYVQVVEQQLRSKDQELGKKDQELGKKDQELSKKDQELSKKDQELSKKDQELGKEKRENNELRLKADELERQLDHYKRKEKAEKNSRRGRSSKSNSPEHKKSRKQG